MSIDTKFIEAQFFTTMHRCNIKPRENFSPIMDGATHRFAVEDEKGSNKSGSGAYFIHADGDCPNWGIMDFHKHSEMQTFKFDFSVFDADTRREYLKQQNTSSTHGISGVRTISQTQKAEFESKQREKANANEKNQQTARDMALAEYRNASDEPGIIFFLSGYMWERFMLTAITIPRKELYPDRFKYPLFQRNYNPNRKEENRYPLKICKRTIPGGCCKYGMLLVPMIDPITNDFKTIIRVMAQPNENGKYDRKIYPGTNTTGSAFILAPNDIEEAECLFTCEGFGTALALFADLDGKFPIFSAGSCGNLLSICKALRTKYKDKPIIIIADNDANHAGEIAAKKCIEAGFADTYEMPIVTGWDWYDDYRSRKGA